MNNYIKSDTFKRRVLVVDDEPINRELLGIMLSDSYEVRKFYVGDRSAALNQVVLGGITYKTLTFNIIEE